MQPETILAFLCLLAVLVEYIHAKDEQYYAFARGSIPKFTGFDFSTRAELLSSSKTESAFIVYKVMMRLLFILLAIFILPYAWAKLFGYCLIGIYFLYQHHHLYEWLVLKKENHGRRTAWMFTPIMIVWWWQVVKMIMVYFST